MPTVLRHAILGACGVGGLLGAILARSGAHVTMIVRPESAEDYPTDITLESTFGNFTVPVEHAVEVPPSDVLWISVKATQLEAALKALRQPESVGVIVPLLNGIDHLSLLRKRYGEGKVIPATIAVETERVAPGQFVHRSPFCRLNVFSGGRSQLSSTLDALGAAGFDCRFMDDEATLMWIKIVFLGPIALATTASGKPIGGIVEDASWRQQWESCVREACAVATAEGAKVDAQVVIAGTAKLPPRMRSSMQKDVELGNVPELDAIAGPILRGAQRHGIKAQATQKLAAAVENKSVGFGR
jgi:2-dehydropantoate 2-reductase